MLVHLRRPTSGRDNCAESWDGRADGGRQVRGNCTDAQFTETRRMDNSGADRNLLFGLLALQNGLIDQVQLVAAFQSWTLQKDRPLADHLVDCGALDVNQRGVVEAMVGLHLHKHGGSTANSLAALPAGILSAQPGHA